MSITLATTFNPRGETVRLVRLYPQLSPTYADIVISLPSTVTSEDQEAIERLPAVRVIVNEDWSLGRYMALKASLNADGSYIHYADMDRLLRWVETKPEEWRQAVERVQQSDCLVFGRTAQAWATHPKALRETEKISNELFSRLLGLELDLSAGSKGFSRRAVEFIVANSEEGRALGADSEWIVLLSRAGYRIDTMLVDGLDWEIPDQNQDYAADETRQRNMAQLYDADASKWAYRVKIAQEIVEAGMDAMRRPLIEV